MYFEDQSEESRFQAAWDSVHIARGVQTTLFTFGTSELPYVLVSERSHNQDLVTITAGEISVKRPTIITPQNAPPDLAGFFDNPEEEGLVQYLMSRAADFSNFRFENHRGERKMASDSVEEVVDRLNRQFDDEDEDRVAILTAPANLGGLAVLRYATERVWESTPSNLQELRERGFLP